LKRLAHYHANIFTDGNDAAAIQAAQMGVPLGTDSTEEDRIRYCTTKVRTISSD